MTAPELEAAFHSLGMPSSGMMSARPVREGTRYRVAKRADGAPCFLILVPEDAPPAFGSRLANLNYLPRERVNVEGGDGTVVTGVFSILSCRSSDAELAHYFFRVVGTLIDELGPNPHVLVVDRAVEAIIELFRALERPGRRSIQGVWAEVLLIANARDPVRALAAWHSDPTNLHDFAVGVDRIEVKSTTTTLREHQFRLDQLSTLTTGVVLVASMMLTSSPDGLTIQDLVELLHRRLPASGEHRSRVESIVARGLGSEWRAMATARFDSVSGIASLRLYNAMLVPSVDPRTPPEVRNVHFSVDLSAASSLTMTEVAALAPQLQPLLPEAHAGS